MSKAIKQSNGIYTVTLADVSAQTVTITGPNDIDFVVTSLEQIPDGYAEYTWLANFTVAKTAEGKKKKAKIKYKVKVNGIPAGKKMVVLENGNLIPLSEALHEKDFDQGDPAIGMTR